jgi:hypothetical protein
VGRRNSKNNFSFKGWVIKITLAMIAIGYVADVTGLKTTGISKSVNNLASAIAGNANKKSGKQGGAASSSCKDVLKNNRISLTNHTRNDLESGFTQLSYRHIDRRVCEALNWAAKTHTIGVSSLGSDHSLRVNGKTSYSNHIFGRAADIYIVDGSPVSSGNHGAQRLATAFSKRTGKHRPDELGQPWWNGTRHGIRVFTKDHGDHIHIGWDG